MLDKIEKVKVKKIRMKVKSVKASENEGFNEVVNLLIEEKLFDWRLEWV